MFSEHSIRESPLWLGSHCNDVYGSVKSAHSWWWPKSGQQTSCSGRPQGASVGRRKVIQLHHNNFFTAIPTYTFSRVLLWAFSISILSTSWNFLVKNIVVLIILIVLYSTFYNKVSMRFTIVPCRRFHKTLPDLRLILGLGTSPKHCTVHCSMQTLRLILS